MEWSSEGGRIAKYSGPDTCSFSSHGTDEGQQILQQPVPERLDFVCSFLQSKHLSYLAEKELLPQLPGLWESRGTSSQMSGGAEAQGC